MVKKKHASLLFVGAVGVVFGDIGTSPLYALQAVFGASRLELQPDKVIGVISLIIWSIILVVSVKYVLLMTRASNNGEGGIMALIALIRRSNVNIRTKGLLTFLALVGISLFYGDSVITPAISVLSAVEGSRLFAPQVSPFVMPLTITILAGLFLLQSRGSDKIGRLFGPIMITWFMVTAIAGISAILQNPVILIALLPSQAINFFLLYPLPAFIAMGAVILAITGAEALYADMGHFGRSVIMSAWFWLVFPALILNYLGQGALVISHPDAITSSYFLLFPSWLHLPVVLLATVATLIASQAVISGAFSLTRQAVQLGFAPRLSVLHTSTEEAGQVYLPALNWILAVMVIIVVTLFGTSTQLANAYGMAVSGTFAIDTILLLVIIRIIWKQSFVTIALAGLLFVTIDALFLSSSSLKLLHGAWVPIGIATIGYVLLSTWYKGHMIISRERERAEGTLLDFVQKLHASKVNRIPGNAVYVGHHAGNAPLSLHETVEQLHELHERVVVVIIETTDTPHVPEQSRAVFDGLGHPNDGISSITLRFGYKDTPNVPKTLAASWQIDPEFNFDLSTATYFTSIGQPVIVSNKRMSKWRKRLYLFMDRNANSSSAYFRLPLDRTVEMHSFLEL